MLFLFLISFILLFLHELGQWMLLLSKKEPTPKKDPAVSILICVRNERRNLESNLPRIIDAMEEGDELIVVDDGSTDGSFGSLRSKSAEWPLVLVRNHAPQGKKRAVDLGVSKATHSYILQSDADCIPRSPEWVNRMRGGIEKGKELILGWSPLEGGSGILGAFLHWDSIRTAMNYSFFARIGLPYMGVGRNMLYKKDLRKKAKMPDAYYKVLSGDDDLLVAHGAARGKVEHIRHPDAHTLSPPPSSWTAYWHQRRRHAESGLHYPRAIKFLLGLLLLAELIFLGLGIALLFQPEYRTLSISLLGALMILRGTSSFWTAKDFAPGALFLLTPLFSLISMMKLIFVDVSVLLLKPTRWR